MKEKLYPSILAIFICIVTYKSFSPDISPGLDASYVWALNSILHTDYSFLTKIIYPIGPLGFLKMPVVIENNLLIATAFTFLAKMLFVFLFLKIDTSINYYIRALVLLIICFFIDIDGLLIGINILALLLYRKNVAAYVFIGIVATIAVLIKSSIGIAINGVIVFNLLYELIFENDRKKPVLNYSIFITTYFVVGSLFLLGPINFIYYNINILKLASAYGESMALQHDKGHYMLLLFGITLVIAFMKIKNNWLLIFLLIFPLFTMWKHVVSREEYFHAKALIRFMPFVFGLLLLYAKNWKLNLAAAFLAMTFYFQHLKNLDNYSPYTFYWNGFKQFNESAINYATFKKYNQDLSKTNLQSSILPDSILKIIGKESIDFYPTELSYAAANKLNWNPRKTLQSGGFSKWLEEEDAKCFESKNGPSFLLIHIHKDNHNFETASFDERNFINDEPTTFLTIIKNYAFKVRSGNLLLFEKRNKPGFLSISSTANPIKYQWNEWIKIDQVKDNFIQTCKLNFSNSLIGKISAIFFKSNLYYIDYKLTNDQIITNRIIKSNSENGIIVNPFISNFQNQKHFAVKEIRFRTKNPKLTDKEFSLINFQYAIPFKIDYPIGDIINQNKVIQIKTDEKKEDLKNVQSLKKEGFSASFTFEKDSIFKNTINEIAVTFEAKLFSDKYNTSTFVITYGEGKNIKWHGDVKNIGENKWSDFSYTLFIKKSDWLNGKLNAYIWNTGQDGVVIGNSKVTIVGINENPEE